MLRLFPGLVLLIGLIFSTVVRSEIVVVVNAENPVKTYSKRELVDLYMGRELYFPDGSLVIRLDQTPDSSVRQLFYKLLVDKTVAEVNAYWARLLFTGRASPPQVVGNDAGVLDAVRRNRNAIGYVEKASVTESVKVVGSVN